MLDALADLRHRWMQAGPAYPGGPAAQARIREYLAPMRIAALDRGGLRAAVAHHHEPCEPFYQAAVTHLAAHHDGTPEALAWLERALADLVPTLPDDVECIVPAADGATRRMLQALGLGPTTVNLAGPTDQARRRLLERWDPPTDLAHLGLALEPLRPDDADDVTALVARVFEAEPAYAWFLARPGYPARLRRRLADGQLSELALTVRVDGRVAGLIEADARLDDPHHGSCLGLGFVLDAPLRGRGIVLVGYRLALDLAVARGAAWIKGSTARPAVLHVARILGRQPVSVCMRRDLWFADGRFDDALAAVERPAPRPANDGCYPV